MLMRRFRHAAAPRHAILIALRAAILRYVAMRRFARCFHLLLVDITFRQMPLDTDMPRGSCCFAISFSLPRRHAVAAAAAMASLRFSRLIRCRYAATFIADISFFGAIFAAFRSRRYIFRLLAIDDTPPHSAITALICRRFDIMLMPFFTFIIIFVVSLLLRDNAAHTTPTMPRVYRRRRR